jgi:bleomycin hydrolase
MSIRSSKVLFALVVSLVAAAPTLRAQDAQKAKEYKGFTIEVEIPRQPVISQDKTGTCWSFATTSFLESELERLHKKRIDLSEMFIVHHAYMEKARRFVRLQGHARWSEGGLSHDVIAMARLFGVVPAEAYSGLCDGDTQHEHAELSTILESTVKTFATAKKPNPRWETIVRRILDAFVGPVPQTVTVDGRQMSPKQYADDVLRIPYDDYVEVMSFGYTPLWAHGELLVPDNWLRYQGYLNIPVDAMMDAMDHALRAGYSVAVDMDVSEKGFDPGAGGVAKLPARLEKAGAITQELRDRAFDNRETEDDHLMHVVGIAKNDDGEIYYLTKNSWGAGVGPFDGYLLMSRNYVALKMLGMMVHKDGLPVGLMDKVKS